MLNMLLGQLTLDVGKFRHLLRVEPPAAAADGRRGARAGRRVQGAGKTPPPVNRLANFQFLLNI